MSRGLWVSPDRRICMREEWSFQFVAPLAQGLALFVWGCCRSCDCPVNCRVWFAFAKVKENRVPLQQFAFMFFFLFCVGALYQLL